MESFNAWLNVKLRELNTDESVFSAYIVGILEGEETTEEKTEALMELLNEITDTNCNQLISTILEKWCDCVVNAAEKTTATVHSLDVNEQLAKLLDAQKLQMQTVKEREYTAEERRIKEQILAQYSETAVSEDEADVAAEETAKPASGAGSASTTTTATNSLGGIERNTNAHDVLQLQKDRREQARLDSAAKKQKDKEDREKQKQLREEKKEKRKTVKGERRR